MSGATVNVAKAQPIGHSIQVPNLLITATESLPDTDFSGGELQLQRNRKIFVADAEAVVEALYASLPGGTLDQILRLMLERKASQFVVTF